MMFSTELDQGLTVLDKFLFYSVISSYHVPWVLGKIKKTGTVTVRGRLSWQEKMPDVLGVELLLSVENLEFVSNIFCAVGDPCLDVRFRF